jgi:hypothetical protein
MEIMCYAADYEDESRFEYEQMSWFPYFENIANFHLF